MEETILWEALYCGCTFESAYATLSIHRTKEGAEKAIAHHKYQEKEQYDQIYDGFEPSSFPWDYSKGWDIQPIKLQD